MLYFSTWKTTLILLFVVLGILFSFPNFFSPSQRLDAEGAPQGIWKTLPSQTIKLGLDLRGGSHLVFEVDMDEVRSEKLNNLREDVRVSLRKATPPILSAPPGVTGDTVLIRLSRLTDLERALQTLSDLNEPVSASTGQLVKEASLEIKPLEGLKERFKKIILNPSH